MQPVHAALELRLAVVTNLRSSLAEGGCEGAACAERIDAALREAACSTGMDGTTARLRAAIRQFQEGGGSLGTAAARELYLDVMSTPGIFAERLELERLVEHLQRPLYLYYSLPGSLSSQLEQLEEPLPAPTSSSLLSPLPAPTETILPSGSSPTTCTAEPLRLLHLVNARHFDLLLPAVRAAP